MPSWPAIRCKKQNHRDLAHFSLRSSRFLSESVGGARKREVGANFPAHGTVNRLHVFPRLVLVACLNDYVFPALRSDWLVTIFAASDWLTFSDYFGFRPSLRQSSENG